MAARKEITLEGWNKKRASAGQPGRAPIYIYRPSGEEKLGGNIATSTFSLDVVREAVKNYLADFFR